MHQVDRVDVEGFWDTHDFKVKLHRDVTFFIGVNGTGKTTLINLIAAVLTGDFFTLERTPFKRITVTLTSTPEAKAPTITVVKSKRKDRSVDLIEYRIKKDANSTESRHSMEEFDDRALRRGEMSKRFLADFYRQMAYGVNLNLANLVQVQWLSVNRSGPLIDSVKDERPFESSVDRKLEQLSNDLVRYFATFTSQKDARVKTFQESIFFSLLQQEDYQDLFAHLREEKRQDLVNSNEMMLADIFRELHVDNPTTDKAISTFFERAREIVLSDPSTKGISIHDVGILFSLRRVEGLIEQWKRLQGQLSEIFAPRDQFLRVANELFQRKEMMISDSNELVFTSRSQKPLTAKMLSSGEKQLLILLSEILLQKQTPSIFVADEPELSLHVIWQEKLVSSLRTLNPHAQIIVATHSPDIVGPLSDRAIDMENLIP
ncbi:MULTISPECIES: AAA family ATPase [unclassified Bradyrhizobium]|uniref:AAA family ATPase n=1 Tax=unclassified Bradyrhizobium TaxID=2631580 RepID=UPI00291677DB|nr:MULTISPECIES: AAA family ATPase [unclassified Bradyrhizobium]